MQKILLILKNINNFLFPERCLGCRKKDIIFCEECFNQVPNCREIVGKDIWTMVDYRHRIIKKAIWLLKYKNKKKIAEILGKKSYDYLFEQWSEKRLMSNFIKPLIVPVPISKKREKKRGYNQSRLIAEEILKFDKHKNFELVDEKIILKIKETPPQAKIKNKKDRLENLKNSFTIFNKEKIFGRNIIIIDDIITTGATIEEIKKILKNSGAEQIISFAIAH